ncbi:hypothetical protein GCM10010967_57950 [Dyadobacter beijingensis]|uniref:Uncharacterized protein n=1 Tax=Dyadobacter beijingensis TaxID=365489 RepID=A0ABQ2IMV1_9BACT|nr:hypothetical protein [Dyadobacter beijingensis]GGN14128.1 hypothetical protein GCM10010967_57950 [Dyadobacter beijingensis]
MDFTWSDLLKMIPSLIGGGAAGAFINNYFIGKRNKIQPVGKRVTASYVDLPTIMPDYSASITLSKNDGGTDQNYSFKKMAIVQVELRNSGMNDIPVFEIGVDLPEKTMAIGFQHQSPDRYHSVSIENQVTIASPANRLDFKLQPFNRDDFYELTIVTYTDDEDIEAQVILSKKLSVKFVDIFYGVFDDKLAKHLHKKSKGLDIGAP